MRNLDANWADGAAPTVDRDGDRHRLERSASRLDRGGHDPTCDRRLRDGRASSGYACVSISLGNEVFIDPTSAGIPSQTAVVGMPGWNWRCGSHVDRRSTRRIGLAVLVVRLRCLTGTSNSPDVGGRRRGRISCTFLETTYYDTNEPNGNELATGTLDDRYKDRTWISRGGLRQRNLYGGNVEMHQRIGGEQNNSQFLLNCNRQLNSSCDTHNRCCTGGVGDNESRIVLAQLHTEISSDELAAALEEHLVQVTEADWELYRARAEYFQAIERLIQPKPLWRSSRWGPRLTSNVVKCCGRERPSLPAIEMIRGHHHSQRRGATAGITGE